MMAPLAPVMGIGVGSFLGRWRSLILSVMEKVEAELGCQSLVVGVAAKIEEGGIDGVVAAKE